MCRDMAESRNGNGKPGLSITFDSIRDKNVEQVKILNSVIFPVNYQVGDCTRIFCQLLQTVLLYSAQDAYASQQTCTCILQLSAH